MSDLDARVAALMVLIDNYAGWGWPLSSGNRFDRDIAEQAIRAELQKPALHKPCTDVELTAARQAYVINSGTNDEAMKAAINSVLQGRAQPADKLEAENRFEHYVQNMIDHAPEPLRRLGEYLSSVLDEDEWATAERMILGVEESRQPAQEEITDADRFQYLCLDITNPAERTVRNALLDRLCVMSYSAACIDIDAAIRASKGEKT